MSRCNLGRLPPWGLVPDHPAAQPPPRMPWLRAQAHSQSSAWRTGCSCKDGRGGFKWKALRHARKPCIEPHRQQGWCLNRHTQHRSAMRSPAACPRFLAVRAGHERAGARANGGTCTRESTRAPSRSAMEPCASGDAAAQPSMPCRPRPPPRTLGVVGSTVHHDGDSCIGLGLKPVVANCRFGAVGQLRGAGVQRGAGWCVAGVRRAPIGLGAWAAARVRRLAWSICVAR